MGRPWLSLHSLGAPKPNPPIPTDQKAFIAKSNPVSGSAPPGNST